MNAIAHAPFGRTGHASSRLIFGAAALGSMSQSRADQTLDSTLAAGINHVDTAASYGESELRLAPFLADHRADVFLATKTGDRSGAEARRSLERSLERMEVDSVDLVQLHNLVEEGEWRTAFATDGAVAALAQARDEGLCRFIGVTGHGTRIAAMHGRSLAEFDFDSVLLPFNYSMMQIDHYREEVDDLRRLCRQRDVAVQTIKSIARRRWTEDQQHRFSWYEPLTDPETISRAVHYVLAEPDLFLNTTSDARLLPHLFEAARRFTANPTAPTASDMERDAMDLDITPLFDGNELERI